MLGFTCSVTPQQASRPTLHSCVKGGSVHSGFAASLSYLAVTQLSLWHKVIEGRLGFRV